MMLNLTFVKLSNLEMFISYMQGSLGILDGVIRITRFIIFKDKDIDKYKTYQ